MDGVDRIVAVVKLWSRLLAGNNVEVALTTGEVLRGTGHADFCAMVELPLVVPKVLSAVVDMAVKALGIEYESTFKALGVLFNLQGAVAQGTLIVSNDAKRVEDTCETITSVARAGLLSPVSAGRLAGRLGFAASQLFGRSGSACLWHLRQRAGGAAFSADLLTTLHESASTLRSAPPWEVKRQVARSACKIVHRWLLRLWKYRCCGFRCSHLGPSSSLAPRSHSTYCRFCRSPMVARGTEARHVVVGSVEPVAFDAQVLLFLRFVVLRSLLRSVCMGSCRWAKRGRRSAAAEEERAARRLHSDECKRSRNETSRCGHVSSSVWRTTSRRERVFSRLCFYRHPTWSLWTYTQPGRGRRNQSGSPERISENLE